MSYFPLYSTGNITITNSQIKSIRTTPVQIIAAPGAGKMISIVSATVKFNYGGNNTFGSGGNLQLMVNNTSGILYSAWNSAIYTGSVDNIYGIVGPQANGATTQGVLENLPIVLTTAASDPTGNAANDNTLIVNVLYQILSM